MIRYGSVGWESELGGITPARVAKFFVPGEPVSKQRPSISNKRAYTPKKTRDAEEFVAQCFKQQCGDLYLEGNLEAELRFYVTNLSKDVDNMEKLVFDALNKVLYKDDRQIRFKVAYKFKAAPNAARSEITIRETGLTYEES